MQSGGATADLLGQEGLEANLEPGKWASPKASHLTVIITLAHGSPVAGALRTLRSNVPLTEKGGVSFPPLGTAAAQACSGHWTRLEGLLSISLAQPVGCQK